MPTVDQLFYQVIIYTYKFVIEKWVNHRYFLIDEKHLQKFGLTGEVISV